MLSKDEIEKLARDIGNLQGNIGFSSPRDVKNAGLYFGALLALQTVFPESVQDINEIRVPTPTSDDELIEARKKQFEDLKK